MKFDLLSLKLFVSICEQHSIARTAEHEHIAASAVSKRISDLEQTVRTRLFHRSQKGLEMTPAAHALLHHARIILRDVSQLESELKDYAKGERGQVRLCASVSTIVQHLPADISAFLAKHPAIRINLEEGLSQGVVEAVADNAADIGVFGGGMPAPGLHVVPYRTDRLVILMPNDHPLHKAESLSFAEVAEHDLVGPQKGSFLDSLVLRAAADLGQPLRLRIRVNGFEPVASMVEANLGVGLVPARQAERYTTDGRLIAVPLAEPWAVRHWRLCSRAVNTLPTPVKLLLQHLSTGGARPQGAVN